MMIFKEINDVQMKVPEYCLVILVSCFFKNRVILSKMEQTFKRQNTDKDRQHFSSKQDQSPLIQYGIQCTTL